MKADKIIKNAKIFTANKDNPLATALVVKDGKFVYVGDEAGLAAYEGEVADLGGKFIMPGILDTHVHVTTSIGFEQPEKGAIYYDRKDITSVDLPLRPNRSIGRRAYHRGRHLRRAYRPGRLFCRACGEAEGGWLGGDHRIT